MKSTWLGSMILACLLCGCGGPQGVSSVEFQRQYARGVSTTCYVRYLGERDGRGYLRISTRNIFLSGWSHRVVCVELSELDPGFRASLPKVAWQDGEQRP